MCRSRSREVSGDGGIERVRLFHSEDAEHGSSRSRSTRSSCNLGSRPLSGPLKDWGFGVIKGAIVVDQVMKTSLDRVWACGDITMFDGKLKLIATGFAESAVAVAQAIHEIAALTPRSSPSTPPTPAYPGRLPASRKSARAEAVGALFQGARLLQAAFHNRSLSLYTKLGFDTREPISTMQGPAIKASTPGYSVRPARMSDLEECNRLCRRVHGHDRSGELRDAIEQGTAVVAERDGRIVAYSSSIGFFGHTVGESNADVQALIATADAFLGPGILVPTRNAGLFRWCLENGLRVVQPMTLMTLGFYNEPAGAYLPSILY